MWGKPRKWDRSPLHLKGLLHPGRWVGMPPGEKHFVSKVAPHLYLDPWPRLDPWPCLDLCPGAISTSVSIQNGSSSPE